MSPDEPLSALRAALAGRYRVERELGAGARAIVHRFYVTLGTHKSDVWVMKLERR